VAIALVALAIEVRTRFKTAPVVIVIGDEPGGTFDHFVELPSIQPDAAALRAEIDLDTLAIADHQVNLALRTLHSALLEHAVAFSPRYDCTPPEFEAHR
jgi:hypothetical protein